MREPKVIIWPSSKLEAEEFFNECHSGENGRFCSSGGVDISDVKKNFREHYGKVEWARELIDSVHGVPSGYPGCKVEVWSDLGGAYGVYNPGTHLIRLAENGMDEFAETTMIHEFGHHISVGVRGQSQIEFNNEIWNDPELKAWMDEVKATSPYKALSEMRRNTSASVEQRDTAAYLLDSRELFARSYSQWIAERSGDRELLEQHRKLHEGTGGVYAWADYEFAGISRALTAYFEKRGLLR